MSNMTQNLVTGQLSKAKTTTFFKWVINNFSSFKMSRGDVILSPVFSTCIDNIESKWQLQFYPQGPSTSLLSRTLPGRTSIYLEHLSEMIMRTNIVFSIAKDGKDVYVKDAGEHTFTKSINRCGYKSYIYVESLTNEVRHSILDDDKLTIICEITVKESDLKDAQTNAKCSECSLELQQDLAKLIDEEKSSDVIFKFPDNNELHAHKSILSSRSAYFAAIFDHDMSEKKCSIVEITDVPHDVFKEMFKFLYVGKVDNIKEMADELLIDSNKYCLDGLKALCENSITYNLAIENAFRYLTLASAHNAASLKSKILEFITEYGKDIIDTEEYKLYEESYPCESCEILRSFFKKGRFE